MLGRPPESLDAIRSHAAEARDLRALLARFIASPEHQSRPGARLSPPPQREAGGPPVTDDDVVWCYRALLGRQPESADSIRTHAAAAKDFRSLVLGFVETPEFRQRSAMRPAAGRGRPTSAPHPAPAAISNPAPPLGPDRLLDPESPASVVFAGGDDQDALERTLDSFIRHNTFRVRDLVIRQSPEAAQHRSLSEKLRDYPFKWLTENAPADRPTATNGDPNVAGEFIFYCQVGWEFNRSGFIEASLKILRHNPDIFQVSLAAPEAADGDPLSESVFFAADVPYRLWRTGDDKGDPQRRPGFLDSPRLRRRRDLGLPGGGLMSDEALGRGGVLIAVLAASEDGRGRAAHA